MSLSTAATAFLAPRHSLPNRRTPFLFLSLPKNSVSIRYWHKFSPPLLRFSSRALPDLGGELLEAQALSPKSAAADSGSDLGGGLLAGLGGKGLVLWAATVCGFLAGGCRRALAVEGVGVLGGAGVYLRGVWPKVLQLLCVFKDQGLVLAALLGLSAFFSMAETSITTLWPWKV